MKHAFIMRGIPGSGKTTTARAIASGGDFRKEFVVRDNVTYCVGPEEELNFDECLPYAAIHSTDMYFIGKDGTYKFNQRYLHKNHNKNYKAFRNSIDAEIPIVICDNVNIDHWKYKKYARVAREAGYIVSVVTMPVPTIKEAVERGVHNIPETEIKRMIREWEP